MPLVRVEVRNEYALGAPELYREANKEDTKEILEGVAFAGLVGVLRQLGDLAEFAAEVFHGLQEEVMITSSRSRKLMGRVKRIEAAVSPLEKAVLAQRTHLHFAYTAGCNWSSGIHCEQNHFVNSDVPQYIMDSYIDSWGPPRLHLLDRFDPGGPGSCLKRYSDPTFFMRASVASGEASTEKISRYKKGCKMKKRRSWARNQEVSRDASVSYHGGRMQFTYMNVGGDASPSQTMSTYDATLRSDFSEQSNLDLGNGSGYIEGDFCPTHSIQPREQEPRESISSPVKRRDNHFVDYNFLEEEVIETCRDIKINLAQDRVGCTSSSVTCDENNGSLDPAVNSYDHNDMILDGDHDTVTFETIGKLDVQICNQDLPALGSGDIHLDDIESETDNFMDALNTIDSECEADIDCTRKNKVEHCSNLEDEIVENGLQEPIEHKLECPSSSSHSNIFANSSSINGSCGRDSILVSPETPYAAHYSISGVEAKVGFNSVNPVDKPLLSAQRAGESLNPGSQQSIDSLENGDISDATNVNSVSCTVSSNFRDDRSGIPIIDGTKSSSKSQKLAAETSNVTSFTFWTNGSLLGLQPSKPPDCSVLNGLPQDPLSENNGEISSSTHPFLGNEKDAWKADKTENHKYIEERVDTDCCTSQGYHRKASWKISPADLDIKLGKFGSSLYQNNACSTVGNVTATGSFLPVDSEFQAARKHQENTRGSSRMFELSNIMSTTGSNKNLLPGGDENSSPATYQNANAFAQKNHQSIVYRTFSGRAKDLFAGDSLIPSPSSSPPLEHMKISFQPIDGFQTSKLNLNFPVGKSNDESSSDIFSSFQLVPEVSITQHKVGLDSDDETLYRSSPSLSDDCHSHESESNSEQWESGESLSSKDHDLYDSLCRISFTESVPTDPENARTSHRDLHDNCDLQFPYVENMVLDSQSCRSFDLQSLGTLNHSYREELRNDTNEKDLEEPQIEPSPATPPLPPVQWRGMKPRLKYVEEKYNVMPEGSDYAFDIKHSASTISQQPKPASFNNDQIFETANVQKSKQFVSQKSNGRREADQGKSINENDFLHQIRAKSFSLRPTVKAKPTMQSGPPANVQVTAILEKANAIRQAVASDGEDDGNWSET
ncbi:hypothetical protein BUALT_Bualt03G0045600 [Buddleja alternifolia]|uniref:Protein SCAR n=1 Tax=Buddleja alternifolia TaxID=168488 RepID=A0AAV6XXU7_9LAMI|nr:hypothetical protein BUALT_Bualt03G0045600 [Buddleja alternifolia]